MATKMESLQARVREMEGVSFGRDDRTDSWMNTWAFQARRELRRPHLELAVSGDLEGFGDAIEV